MPKDWRHHRYKGRSRNKRQREAADAREDVLFEAAKKSRRDQADRDGEPVQRTHTPQHGRGGTRQKLDTDKCAGQYHSTPALWAMSQTACRTGHAIASPATGHGRSDNDTAGGGLMRVLRERVFECLDDP